MARTFGSVLLILLAAAPAMAQLSASFQQDVNGYVGTLDTEFRTQGFFVPRGANTSISVDNDDDGHQTQAAIRFDDIFVSEGGLVPDSDVLIAYASLRVFVTSSTDPNAVVSFHRVLSASPWDESSTWGGLGGDTSPDLVTGELDGDPILQNNVESLIVPDAVLLDPDADEVFVEFDVRTSVEAWFNGATNLGWAINNTTGSGWDFLTSEFVTDPSLRPTLTVGWVIEPGDIDGDLDVDLVDFQDLLDNMAIQLDGPILPGHPGDLDFDKDVDLDDFNLFKGYYLAFPGNGGEAALAAVMSGVPEPSTATLAMLFCVVTVACWRRVRV